MNNFSSIPVPFSQQLRIFHLQNRTATKRELFTLLINCCVKYSHQVGSRIFKETAVLFTEVSVHFHYHKYVLYFV
jgi:hypothetical protein